MAASNVSGIMSFNIQKEIKPPILEVVDGSVALIEPSGNKAIDANEQCKIQFKVRNYGLGDAINCVARISISGDVNGLSYKSKKLPTIPVDKTILIEIPIMATMSTIDGKIDISVYVEEPMGFGTDKVLLTADVNAFVAPLLKVVDYTVTNDKGGVLTRSQTFDLQLLLQNTQHGTAEDVIVSIDTPDNIYVLSEPEGRYAKLGAGEKKSLIYGLAVNNKYEGNLIPINVSIREKYGKYSENKTINIHLNQKLASNKIVIDSEKEVRQEIQIASLTSDVDKNIPKTSFVNDKTFVVIIANENYQSVSNVPFAINDGEVFSKYCNQTLGIPQTHIRLVKNATLNNIKHEIDWLSQVIDTYKEEDTRVIFYYAGHGIPDESNKTSYLLPVDGHGHDVSTGYRLDNLYKKLGELPSESILVLLDACFSGSTREGGMLASARGVAIKAKSGQPIGNMVVMSASQGDETAYPYKEKQHGMFTYFLLKKLQDTKGDVTLSELSDYVTKEVTRKSIVENDKIQTPVLIPSSDVAGNWQNWNIR